MGTGLLKVLVNVGLSIDFTEVCLAPSQIFMTEGFCENS